MVAVLPLIKLGGLLVRQFSKPIANIIKGHATSHPQFRRVFIGFGQVWHRLELNIKIRFLGHVPIAIKSLPEEKALVAGADVFGELFVYSVAVGVLWFELKRSSYESAIKQAHINQSFDRVAERVERLQQQINRVDEQLTGVKAEQAEEGFLPRLSMPHPGGLFHAFMGAVKGNK
eukprot:comp12652_c0_seq1/m.7716 comp12652_c0_seq1/g.7716  ORF comp12652_c0_seq1/g.7716 comp12652_c0_seq1/m.7716 type:complete len:175 (-) comp12652_c0_seq1:128-652(-)